MAGILEGGFVSERSKLAANPANLDRGLENGRAETLTMEILVPMSAMVSVDDNQPACFRGSTAQAAQMAQTAQTAQTKFTAASEPWAGLDDEQARGGEGELDGVLTEKPLPL
jgi:hypothetical protein